MLKPEKKQGSFNNNHHKSYMFFSTIVSYSILITEIIATVAELFTPCPTEVTLALCVEHPALRGAATQYYLIL